MADVASPAAAVCFVVDEHHSAETEIEVTYVYQPHPGDEMALRHVAKELSAVRQSLGLSSYAVAKDVNTTDGWVNRLEKGVYPNPQLSTYQAWAHALGMRLEPSLDRFWLYSWPQSEAQTLFAMSRPWGAHAFVRMWLVSALKQWRLRQGLRHKDVAATMGITESASMCWESTTEDPTMFRLLNQARAVGTQVTWRLYSQDEWIYT